jgi:hypothetical protein
MQRSPRSARIVHRFPKPIEQQLQMYALAASAAGVGFLALAPRAAAKIVFTATNQPIVGRVAVDLNNDGINDFYLATYPFSSCTSNRCSKIQRLYASGAGLWGTNFASGRFVSALPTRFLIGNNKGKFGVTGTSTMALFENSCTVSGRCGGTQLFGQWPNVRNRYMGVSFLINGQTHYGWARLTVKTNSQGISATLTGYAYETDVNEAILIGNGNLTPDDADESAITDLPDAQPRSLGSLALGAYARARAKTRARVAAGGNDARKEHDDPKER